MSADLSTDVELVAVDSLIPYSNNPKEHPDEQVKKIASSIKNYGWDVPIVTDGDGEIIKGHGRMQAAELLGLDEVPVIRRADLSDAEAKASRIADNKTAESAWDDELLGIEVEQLTGSPVELDTLGFDDGEIDSLLGDVSMDDEDIKEAFDNVPDGDRDDVRTKSFTLAVDQIEDVESAIDKAQSEADMAHHLNDNSNGNALAHVCRSYLGG